MNDSPLLNKMDALLKKHRGPGVAAPESSAERAPPPGAWLPVLTDVIEYGTPAADTSAPSTGSKPTA